jgi:type I restriction enzyme R subunit
MMAVLQDDTELFKRFSDDDSFRRMMTDTVSSITDDAPDAGPRASSPPSSPP